jgi:hypothetical protein
LYVCCGLACGTSRYFAWICAWREPHFIRTGRHLWVCELDLSFLARYCKLGVVLHFYRMDWVTETRSPLSCSPPPWYNLLARMSFKVRKTELKRKLASTKYVITRFSYCGFQGICNSCYWDSPQINV